MKFMKLGSRPDTFYTSEAVRSVSSEVASDLIVQVKATRFSLHKFPLLSKCQHLQRLCSETSEPTNIQIVQLPEFPGGAEAFELCAKFCYGITITLSANNLVPIRCAAEYLQMSEDVDRGNLIHKVEVFFSSCILRGWRDSIITLQTTKAYSTWCENLKITSRCIDAIASRVLSRPKKANDGKGWWGDHLAELAIDLYWRAMVAVKSGGKVPNGLIGEALRIYASRWLHLSDSDNNSASSKQRLLLESIVSLLPAKKGDVSCGFLSKLLKAANILKASASSKQELAKRIGQNLDEASVNDLLIPAAPSSSSSTMFDVDVVITILDQFMLQGGQSPSTSPKRGKATFEMLRRRSRSAENLEAMLQEEERPSSASHGSKLKVAKLVDAYLQKIAEDRNLPLSKFVAIAEAVPRFARVDHDDLYKAVDVYLKGHPELSKCERKRICRILDCRKLSMEACMHAAQNEMLPLRVVVQVLFFEQARAAMSGGQVTDLPSNIKALLAVHNNKAVEESPKSNVTTLRTKLEEDDNDFDHSFVNGIGKPSKVMTPNRPGRMLRKLWPVSRSGSEKK